MAQHALLGIFGAKAVKMPLHPTQEIVWRGVQAARADDDRSGRDNRERFAVGSVALHQASLLFVGDRKARVLHPERTGNVIL